MYSCDWMAFLFFFLNQRKPVQHCECVPYVSFQFFLGEQLKFFFLKCTNWGTWKMHKRACSSACLSSTYTQLALSWDGSGGGAPLQSSGIRGQCSPGSDLSQEPNDCHHRSWAISCCRKWGVNRETPLLRKQHGLDCLYYLLSNGQCMKRQCLMAVGGAAES